MEKENKEISTEEAKTVEATADKAPDKPAEAKTTGTPADKAPDKPAEAKTTETPADKAPDKPAEAKTTGTPADKAPDKPAEAKTTGTPADKTPAKPAEAKTTGTPADKAPAKPAETKTAGKPPVSSGSRAPREERPPYRQGGPQKFRQNRGGFRSRQSPFLKKKVCRFCIGQYEQISYKDVTILKKFITERGKILPRRVTGNCAKHQRRLANAVKRGRLLAILPFV